MKCFDKMTEIRNSGATVVVVSHNLNAVRRMCDHTMVLHNGTERFFGATPDAISLFHQLLGEAREPEADGGDADPDAEVRGLASVESWTFVDDEGAPRSDASVGDVLTFEATVSFTVPVVDPLFAFSISTQRGQMVYGEAVRDAAGGGRFGAGDTTTFRVRVTNEMVTGSYKAGLALADSDTLETIASARPVHFFVHGRDEARGVADMRGAFDFRRS
jgi:hypothetical protein